MKKLLDIINDNNKPLAYRVDFFYDFINEKVEDGWDRNRIFLMVEALLNHHNLEENIADAIYEFKTSLIGDAAPASIFRFKGDPENDNDLANYVRSFTWRY